MCWRYLAGFICLCFAQPLFAQGLQGSPKKSVESVEPILPGVPGNADFHRRLKKETVKKGKEYSPRTHHFNADGTPKYVNRLILENSPYLLQHAHNPVNWRPWGDDAFQHARELNRPVLLSVGYSTCHWCHVMEKESFEDVEIARYINQNFIAIKVDREERPDVDDIYMSAVHLLHGRGGWPMTVVMTPARQPFFGGTYFPARDGDRGARKGFFTILKELRQRYEQDPDGVVAQAKEITRKLKEHAQPQTPGAVPSANAIQRAAENFARRFDTQWGGFGRRPKFPRPVTLDFLMRYHRRTGDPQAMHMVALTLEKMAAGGMHDQVGGGFHRYSVDDRWRVPHFEKMLYDNAQLAMVYVDAYQMTRNERFRAVARHTLDYVLREMTSTNGAYFSATDADSLTPDGHREEGWFFTWTPDEIRALVGDSGLKLVRTVYGLTDRGNFEGRNILYLPRSIDVSAQRLGWDPEALRTEMKRIDTVLYAHRSQRPPPLLDDKVLVSWNGLMISAMARAGRILEEEKYIRSAERAAGFILDKMRRPNGRLLRTWRENISKLNGYLEDYAFLIAGLLDLYEATGNHLWFQHAVQLQNLQDTHYSDEKGYFTTSNDHETLLTREKPGYDGAQPAGNSISAMNLMRLYTYTSQEAYRTRADGVLSAFSRNLNRQGASQPALLSALEMRLDSPLQVIIIGEDEEGAKAFDHVLRDQYLPNKALIRLSEKQAKEQSNLIPILAEKVAKEGKTTAYVCEDSICQRPTSDALILQTQLMRLHPLFPENQRRSLYIP